MAFHREAFEMYRQKIPLPEIAERIGKSYESVRKWSCNEKWKNRLAEESQKLEKIAFEERAKIQREIIRDSSAGISSFSRTFKKAAEHFEKKGCLPTEWNEDHLKTLGYIADKSIGSFRKLFPEIDKEALQRLIEEMKNAKSKAKD